jgi:hypothetical protein
MLLRDYHHYHHHHHHHHYNSYSQDDRSERLFEVSLAAELIKSHLSTTYATIITDILLAGHQSLQRFADTR